MHSESLSAFVLLHYQLRSAVKGIAKWSVWRVSLLKPQVLERKFIQSVRSSACSFGWLPGLKFLQLAMDFKCPVRNVSGLIFAFQLSGFPKEWQILKSPCGKPMVCLSPEILSHFWGKKIKNGFNVPTPAT